MLSPSFGKSCCILFIKSPCYCILLKKILATASGDEELELTDDVLEFLDNYKCHSFVTKENAINVVNDFNLETGNVALSIDRRI